MRSRPQIPQSFDDLRKLEKPIDDLLRKEMDVLQQWQGEGTGKLQFAEARVAPLINGVIDSLEEESRSGLIWIGEHSRFLESFLSDAFRGITETSARPNVEVALVIDLNASMTTSSPLKRLSTGVLVIAITNVLARMYIPTRHFAFGERKAIWRLCSESGDTTRELDVTLPRLVAALYSEGRRRSYPLDAIVSVEREWVTLPCRARETAEEPKEHLTIVISDFIGVQVLDTERNWVDIPPHGKRLLLALNTGWNPNRVHDEALDRIARVMPLVRVNPLEIWPEFQVGCETLKQMARVIADSLHLPFSDLRCGSTGGRLEASHLHSLERVLRPWAQRSFPRLLSSIANPPIPPDLELIGNPKLLLMDSSGTSETSIPGVRINDQIAEHQERLRRDAMVRGKMNEEAQGMIENLRDFNSHLTDAQRTEITAKIQHRLSAGSPRSESDIISFLLPNLNVRQEVVKAPLATIDQVWRATQMTWDRNFNVAIDDPKAPFHIFAGIANKFGLEVGHVESPSDMAIADAQKKCSDFALENGFLCPHSLFLLGSRCPKHQVKGITLHLKLDMSHLERQKEAVLGYVRRSLGRCLTRGTGYESSKIIFTGIRSGSLLMDAILELHDGMDVTEIEERCAKIFGPQYLSATKHPVVTQMQMNPSDKSLAPQYNKDYGDPAQCGDGESRGGVGYTRPKGWLRYGLKVDGFGNDDTWIGNSNAPREWFVAYSGTRHDPTAIIVEKGVQCTLDPEYAAAHFAEPFDLNAGGIGSCQFMFMCRVSCELANIHLCDGPDFLCPLNTEDDKRKHISMQDQAQCAWEITPDAVRSYGLLVKFTKAAIQPPANPEQEPYFNSFQGFKILIVCLYSGQYEKTPTKDAFTEQYFATPFGAQLRRKGFEYKFTHSYGDALLELTRQEAGRCPYSQLWLFSSSGTGVMPPQAIDKKSDLIIPFLHALNDFWQAGGGLLLFCDNEPYNFEVNYLFEHILRFPGPDKKACETRLRMGGGYIGKKVIRVANSNDSEPKVQSFSKEVTLGKCPNGLKRLSLRPGLVEFNEGNTISYAVDSNGKPISLEDELWPFTPFAWTSEQTIPPRPFILFYDPEPTSSTLECPGPIVVHGGFTSAFECAEDETKGTERLLVSIACWLTRMEFRLPDKDGLPRNVKGLTKGYPVNAPFRGWQVRRRHAILCLDVSGSMESYYGDLLQQVNRYIDIEVNEWNGVISIVLFDDHAKVLFVQKTDRITAPDIEHFGGGTEFSLALEKAQEVVAQHWDECECRIIFFTDGQDLVPAAQIAALNAQHVRMDVIGLGERRDSVLKQLPTSGGEYYQESTMAAVGDRMVQIAARMLS